MTNDGLDPDYILVKSIKLRTDAMGPNHKIFREVNALSRLTHRNIVRYYTTWLETSIVEDGLLSSTGSTRSRISRTNSGSSTGSDDSNNSGDDAASTGTAVTERPNSQSRTWGSLTSKYNPRSIDLDDLRVEQSLTGGTFQMFDYGPGDERGTSFTDDEETDTEDEIEFIPPAAHVARRSSRPPTPSISRNASPERKVLRTLFIQMVCAETSIGPRANDYVGIRGEANVGGGTSSLLSCKRNS